MDVEAPIRSRLTFSHVGAGASATASQAAAAEAAAKEAAIYLERARKAFAHRPQKGSKWRRLVAICRRCSDSAIPLFKHG